ncbi:MAG: hypothetical protein WCF85_07355 [Rhodospirillaceae bacterium]
MKVLHLPTIIGGNSWSLSQGERRLGWSSEVLNAGINPFGYSTDIDLGLDDRSGRWHRLARTASAFMELRTRYDVFHFNGGISLMHAPRFGLPLLELPFYPARSKLFVTFQGCDARQKFPTMQRTPVAACHDPACYGGACNSGARDRQRRGIIEKFARHVEHFWAVNPDLLNFLPEGVSSFLPYAVLVKDENDYPPSRDDVLRIAHAPTNRVAKGSQAILAAIDRLSARYPGKVELILIEGKSHEEALQLYQHADLVIDQILIGWYGAFAVEAMMLGKPVIARIDDNDLHFLPPEFARALSGAVISAEPSTIDAVLAEWATDKDRLVEQGRRARAFARRWHSPEAVARITTGYYRTSTDGVIKGA